MQTNKKHLYILLLFFFILQIFFLNFVYSRFNPNPSNSQPTLTDSIDNWVKLMGQGDAAAYLRVAKVFYETNELNDLCENCQPNQKNPFYFWGPGSPFYLSLAFRLFGAASTKSLFYLFAISNFISSIFLLLTLFSVVSNFWSRLIGICLITYIPPVHEYIFTTLFASSEFVCMMFFSIFYFAFFKLIFNLKANSSNRKIILYSILAGNALGFIAITREANVAFAYFLATCLASLAIFSKDFPVKKTLFATALLLSMMLTYTNSVKQWNKQRIGIRLISSSGDAAIWRGIWTKPDEHEGWHVAGGVGFGYYLDKDIALKVNAEMDAGKSNFYSFKELLKLIIKKPAEAFLFRFKRLPVLFFGTREWPYSEITYFSFWCIFSYTALGLFVFFRILNGILVPPPVYFYTCFLSCAAVFIHYEFRYSQPIWFVLPLIPTLLIEDIRLKFYKKPTFKLNFYRLTPNNKLN